MKNGLIRSILLCCNPKINITDSHYVCGYNLALFSSFAEVENSLSCLTKNFKDKCSNLKLNHKN